MNYVCEICGKPFEPFMKTMGEPFWDIPYPNKVRVEIVYPGSLAIHSFKTCQNCAGEVIAFINHRKREATEKGK